MGPVERQFAVLGPLQSGVATRAFLGVEMRDGRPAPGRPVVVVWMPEHVVADERQLARLKRETAFVTQLRHPHLIDVHGLVHFEEGWARVVEFIDGEPLTRVLADARRSGRSVPPELAARIVVDACEGVAHAHEEGMSRFNGRAIVHGGLRPDTLMVGFDGSVRVTGYGAAVLAPTVNGAPDPDILFYLAPEQILGGRGTASPATDVYALGAVLFEILAGHPPFAEADNPENAVLAEPPPTFGEDGLTHRLGVIAARAMAKRGPDRFESVDAMKVAVLDALADEAVVLPGAARLATLLADLIPVDAPERAGRRSLLASAVDPDSVSPLTQVEDPVVATEAGSSPSSPPATSSPPADSSLDPVAAPSSPHPASAEDAAAALSEGSSLGQANLSEGFEDAIDTEVGPAEPTPAGSGDVSPRVPAHATPDLPPPAVPPPSMSGTVPAPSGYTPAPAYPTSGFAAQAPVPTSGFPASVPASRPTVVPVPPRVAPRSNPGQPPLAPLEDPRLANPPVTGLPPAPEKSSSPIRETSASITHFNRRAGDASRSVFVIVLTVAAALLAFIFLFSKTPPEGLDEPPTRTRLPPELIKEAIDRTAEKTEQASSSAEPRESEGADSGVASPSAEASAQVAALASSPALAAVDAAPPPPTVPARLHIDSDPAVSVFVDDQPLGRTPITATLPPGRHRVRLTDAETGINAYRTLRLRSGQRLSRSYAFGTCQLLVDAPEGAIVKLNARVLGTAPLEEQTIYEGSYLLRVSYLGAVWSERFEAPAGGRLTYTVTLKDAPR